MRVSLIGPGDIEFHYYNLLGLSKNKFESELEKIAQALVDSDSEIELLPDKGVSLEIAKAYKQKGGKRVIGTIPKSDTTFGIKHLQEYIEIKIDKDNKPLFNEFIDTENWFKHDLIKGLMGNVLLCLGSSPGTDGERQYAVYLYKLIKGFKQGVKVENSGKRIHPEIRADKNYSIIVYSPFLINKKLPPEDEAYLAKFEIPLFYANNPNELLSKLKELSINFK